MRSFLGIGQPTGWRQVTGSGLHSLLVGAFVLLIPGIAMVLATSSALEVLRAVPQTKARPVRTLAEKTEGPGVFYGKLRGQRYEAPNGEEAVGWIGWLEKEVRRNKSTSYETVCTLSRLDGMALEDETGNTVLVAVPADSVSVAESYSFKPPSPTTFTVIAPMTTSAPASSVLETPSCIGPESATLQFKKVVFKNDTPAVVSGCLRQNRIEPCGDRADFLVTQCGDGDTKCAGPQHGVEAAIGHWRGGIGWVMAFSLAFSSLPIGIIGILVLRTHREIRRRQHGATRV